MYRQRTLSRTSPRISDAFPVLLLTGPRQVGKTTLLEHCGGGNRRYVTLDDLEQREIARSDPALFLHMHPAPGTIDEVQQAPQLFSHLKLAVDKARRAGPFLPEPENRKTMKRSTPEHHVIHERGPRDCPVDRVFGP